MSEWIDAQLRDLRQMQEDIQRVIDALDPPKRRRRRRPSLAASPERRELDLSLRTASTAPRAEERRRIMNGEREVAYVTRGGEQA